MKSYSQSKLNQTLNEIIHSIEMGDIHQVDYKKLDEASLFYISKHVLGTNLNRYPKSIFKVKDIRKFFIDNFSEQLVTAKNDLKELIISDNKTKELLVQITLDTFVCTLLTPSSKIETKISKDSNSGKVFEKLLSKRGFVSVTDLIKSLEFDGKDLSDTEKSREVYESIRAIRDSFKLQEKDPDNFIESNNKRYRISIPIEIE
ncbi:MAG: hypothetical protein COV78_00165 [Candidatus Pacebacteria bacterium CG11_big_fil_rev_8_21_14_0_20_34_55]|nr:MAG: hypothetical protein COV78_00165 [Candidatus Pacebacteria bacterium CG11_big_fil_rev_8_21_14_0_20_34_55]